MWGSCGREITSIVVERATLLLKKGRRTKNLNTSKTKCNYNKDFAQWGKAECANGRRDGAGRDSSRLGVDNAIVATMLHV